jgi:hypothetical protein
LTVSIARSTDIQQNEYLSDILKRAPQAQYNTGPVSLRRRCTEHTREQILNDLMEWAQDDNGAKVYWLCGMAGTGKTTITYSFCERLKAEDPSLLGASFFCSRTLEETQDIRAVFPTIACQLASAFIIPPSKLFEVVQNDDSFARCSPEEQLTHLILDLIRDPKTKRPLARLYRPRIIALDAFDEFRSIVDARTLLKTLMKFVPELPKIKFFITSRQEPLDQVSKHMDGTAFYLHNVEQSLVRSDIELYLKERRGDIRMTMGLPSTWLTDKELEKLLDNAGTLFIYASTVCLFLENSITREDCKANLELVLNSDNRNNLTVAQYSQLDGLYSQVLTTAYQGGRHNSIVPVLRVVITALNPLPISTIACLLKTTDNNVSIATKHLAAVITIPDKMDIPVLPFHASFPDFLHDASRSKEYHIHEVDAHYIMLGLCLDVLDSSPALKQDICDIRKNTVHISKISHSSLESISKALEYSSIYWLVHLNQVLKSKDGKEQDITQVLNFFNTRILHWIECMALLGRLGDSVRLLRQIELSQNVSPCKICRAYLLRMYRPVPSFVGL